VSLPRKTENGVRYARLATRGVLTRLALLFQSDPEKIFTGAQVAEIIVRACIAIGSPEDKSLPPADAAIQNEVTLAEQTAQEEF
jgi:hypothetical protein